MNAIETQDYTYGYTEETLLQVGAPPMPPDFEAFWQRTYAESLAVDLEIEQRQVVSPNPDFDLFEVEYNSLGDVRAGGWLIVPKNAKPECAVVMSHGYGGRSEPTFSTPAPPAVVFQYCARGFHRSARPDIPDTAAFHVIHGIEHRETYVHRGCVADTWGAGSVLLELYPEAARTLHYMGGSFGGGIGAMAVAWDKRLSRAFLDVPSFGNHPLRVTLPCFGSGEAVRSYYKRHPEVLDVLRYYDSAIHAGFITIPTFVAAALADGAVPPPGQFAVYNAIKSGKDLYVRSVSHPDEPRETDELHPILTDWFTPKA